MTTEAQKKAFKKYNEKRKGDRVSLSISKESKLILDHFKQAILNKTGINVTYDELIENLFK